MTYAVILISSSTQADSPKIHCNMTMENWCLTPVLSKLEISRSNDKIIWRIGSEEDHFIIEESIECRFTLGNIPWKMEIKEEDYGMIQYHIKRDLCVILITLNNSKVKSNNTLRYVENGILFFQGNEGITISKMSKSY